MRSDSGFGCDYNIDYVLDAGFQILTKGYGGKRPVRLIRQLSQATWIEVGQDRWVARVPDPPSYLKPTQYLLLRWRNQSGELKHSSVICSILDWSMPEVIQHYDDRGACETQIQSDKGGLKMCKRRKAHLDAQEALILLTDLAHNLLAWSSSWMFPAGLLTTFGTTRLIEDMLALPGRLVFDDHGHLVEIQMNRFHPYAEEVSLGLRRLLDHFGNP